MAWYGKPRRWLHVGDDDMYVTQIDDGVWVVARLGWSQFYLGGEDWDGSLYVNALNHPGFSRGAIDKLIEIMDAKGVTISDIAADSLSTDSGQGAKGAGRKGDGRQLEQCPAGARPALSARYPDRREPDQPGGSGRRPGRRQLFAGRRRHETLRRHRRSCPRHGGLRERIAGDEKRVLSPRPLRR